MTPADKCEPLANMISESVSGNQKMQQLLYQKYAPAMYNICLRYTKNATEAEDILQDGFIKVFRNLHNFRGNGCFEGWLKKIISHTAISYFRSASRKIYSRQTDLNYFIEDNEYSVLDRLAEKDIVNTVTKLPTGYRTIFILYVIEGYSHKEIAGILGCSEGNCKSQLNRSRMHLQKMLKKRLNQ
jgi:RNA polymerase sigma factor (sigma-70 family)